MLKFPALLLQAYRHIMIKEYTFTALFQSTIHKTCSANLGCEYEPQFYPLNALHSHMSYLSNRKFWMSIYSEPQYLHLQARRGLSIAP